MRLKGRLTISRASCNQSDDYILIRIADEGSSIEFASAEVSLSDFAQALTGLGHVPCKLELRGMGNVGKRRETKTELLPRLDTSLARATREAAARQTVKPYEVDGWSGYWRDLLNSNNWTGDNRCRVNFVRFVDDNATPCKTPGCRAPGVEESATGGHYCAECKQRDPGGVR